MRRRRGVAGLAALVVGACVGLSLVGGSRGVLPLPISPKGAARAESPCGALPPRSFRTATRTSQGESAVFIVAECYGQPGAQLGWFFLMRDGMFWMTNGGGCCENTADHRQVGPVEYAGGGRSDGRDTQAVVYGRVVEPEVVAVEAVFDNGRTLRDEPTEGIFGLIAPGSEGVCELRALGEGGEVLGRINTMAHAGDHDGIPQGAVGTWSGNRASEADCERLRSFGVGLEPALAATAAPAGTMSHGAGQDG